MYYGPSAAGKTLAISSALEGFCGVFYVSMRGASDEHIFGQLSQVVGHYESEGRRSAGDDSCRSL